MSGITWCAVGGLALAVLGTAAPAAAAGSQADCTALATAKIDDRATDTVSRWVAADAKSGAPAYCEVAGFVSPAAGSRIGIVYRLPERWNGKLLGLGGGGWAGNVRPETAIEGLKRGYATAQTDGGHPGTNPWDNRWSSNPEAVKDFAYRAIHEMTVTGKAVVARYYGRPQAYALYQGCSTGGRMGLMEAQRFPADYDGIIAGAPVYSLQVQTSSLLRNQTFSAPGASFTDAQLAMVGKAAVASCDASDGLKDGLITDPQSCKWNPAVLMCKAGKAGGDCLSGAQVKALNTAYDGIRAPDGSWAAFPMSRGGEAGWSRFVRTGTAPDITGGGGMITLKPLLFGDRLVDMNKLRADRDVAVARSSAFAKTYEATDPDLRAFIAHGGKLILWHGQSDPGPSPVGTADYYKAVERTVPQAKEAVRLFFAPGVEHCGGGPGADQPDTLTALEQWIEQGQAPRTILATRADGSLTRPLCPFPAKAHYAGSGDPNQPAAYSCR
jgi:feruloyl esterase